ncbi:MAG: response regulator transcription factor [Bacteroidota bacterium]|nr:response regulator transcription factor [Bacteroidota bacterium]MDP4214384.1 response regulator transcription factor [Bacteroidota bacterium]MDP4249554.1 response regulator transcription factor [Bacteroidota bacterium]
MYRFLIADDHTVVRKGLKQILVEAFPSALVEEVTDAEGMLKMVFTQQWDVVISDISMPGRSGLEVLQQVKLHYPKLPVLILSVHSEDLYALRVLKSGAAGYLNKDSAPEQLVAAVNRVMQGKKYITPTIAEKLANSLDHDMDKLSHEYLSDREFEVLKLIAGGKTVSDIASRLSLSVTTISTYRSRIMVKMNLKTNAELTLYAIENKLI